MKKVLLGLLCCLCFLDACGGGGGGNPPPPVATHFTVTPATATPVAGVAFNITVTALDASGSIVPTYSGTVHFTSTDRQAVLPANSALTSGTGTFSATLKTAAGQTITVNDTGVPALSGGSSAIIVSAGPATHFTGSGPAAATDSVPFTFTVTALDIGNNIAADYSGTVHFTSTDAKAILPANSSLTNGTGNFPVTLESPGNQTVTATDTVTASLTATSNSIAATAPPPLMITSGAPPNGTVDASYGPSRTQFFVCHAGRGCTPCSPSLGTCGPWPNCPAVPVCIERVDFSGFPLMASGGVPPYTWNASSLPPGLAVITQQKVFEISGTPPAGSTGVYKNVVVTVNDSGTPPGQNNVPYTITISNPAPPAINTTPAPSAGGVNLPYSFTFTAEGGQRPLTWSATGALPAGVAPLSSAGILSGTPTQTGEFPIKVSAQDSLGQNSAPQNFTISIFLHGFKATGSMGAARSGQTATLLGSGKVLVAGGSRADFGLPTTAELFDPATGSFAATGSMGTARLGYTATLLGNGRVLVTGGFDGNEAVATAEVFDPSTGKFTPTKGSMGTARRDHAAILLGNSKVLVAGGVDSGSLILTTAEVFDPATGNFTAASSMGTTRLGFTATLLGNGKVLLTGGSDANGNPLTTSELFDSPTGSFTPTGSLGTARKGHTATLLATGKVLVTGGSGINGDSIATGELFDPVAGTFAPTGTMVTGRTQHTATLLKDGTVLLTGGYDQPVNEISVVSSAEIFNPNSGSFTATGSMAIPRVNHTATLLNNGNVLVTGGSNELTPLTTAELYQ